MAKVRVRKETGKLYLDFMFAGHRCREQTALSDTPANRKKAEALLQRVQAKILLGELNYAEFFPGSGNIAKVQPAESILAVAGGSKPIDTPLFADFADLWFDENKIQWRSSHTKNVDSILNSSLKPIFKGKHVSEITKPDILKARNKMAKRPGRGPSRLMSAKSINNHMNILQMVMTEAADRYDFTNPYRNIKPLRLQRVHIEPFSLSEVETILRTVREDYRNYYLVRFYTGMRTDEIDGLKWEYVDFERREILVRETLIAGETEYTKTDGSQREIPMFGPVYDALKEQHAATGRLSKYCQWPLFLTLFWPIKLTHPCSFNPQLFASVDSFHLP